MSTTKKIKCPDCGAAYAAAKGLSSHRRAAHGYVSMAATAVREREKKAAVPNPLACPDCDHVAATLQALVWHRKKEHGYEGTRHRERQIGAELLPPPPDSEDDPLQCKLCSFIAATKGGLSHHMTRKHGAAPNPTSHNKRRELEPKPTKAIVVSKANGHVDTEASHAPSDGIPEATLALALGRFQGLCQGIAYEFDLPPRLFAARLAGLIYRSTVR